MTVNQVGLFVAVLFVPALEVVELYPPPPVQPLIINHNGARNNQEGQSNRAGGTELVDSIPPSIPA